MHNRGRMEQSPTHTLHRKHVLLDKLNHAIDGDKLLHFREGSGDVHNVGCQQLQRHLKHKRVLGSRCLCIRHKLHGRHNKDRDGDTSKTCQTQAQARTQTHTRTRTHTHTHEHTHTPTHTHPHPHTHTHTPTPTNIPTNKHIQTHSGCCIPLRGWKDRLRE